MLLQSVNSETSMPLHFSFVFIPLSLARGVTKLIHDYRKEKTVNSFGCIALDRRKTNGARLISDVYSIFLYLSILFPFAVFSSLGGNFAVSSTYIHSWYYAI